VVGQFANIYVFIDTFPLKADRAAQIVRRSCMRFHILHEVPMTLHALYMWFQWYRMHNAYGFIDTSCLFFLHSKAVSPLILPFRSCSKISCGVNGPHVSCMRCQWPACSVHAVSMTPHVCKKALAPWSGAQDGCFNEKKTGGRKSCTVQHTL
jgi:hypothetical protein